MTMPATQDTREQLLDEFADATAARIAFLMTPRWRWRRRRRLDADLDRHASMADQLRDQLAGRPVDAPGLRETIVRETGRLE